MGTTKKTGKKMNKPDNIDKAEAEAKLQKLIEQNQAETSRFKYVSFMENRFGPLAFALLFAGIGGFLIFHSSAAPKPAGGGGGKTTSASVVAMTLSPASSNVANGNTVTTEVWVDTLNQSVNAVEADLSYPVDKLQFVSVDDTSSAFSIAAQTTGDAGKVVIARGTTTPVSGKQLVAKVTFKAIAASGQAPVAVLTNSQALSSSDNTNVLVSFGTARYRLTN